ncbi:hypothetical protein [Bradyrhizobium sp.]|uniref:hypothetical protein n=1 Tax=Bradyrhizobium sp. TaxID=376 RepID=UPI003BB0E58A
MTKSAKKITKKPVAKKAANGHGSKTAKAVALMRRPKGATREEILKVLGWRAVSPAQLVRGGKVKIDDSVRPFRYRAVQEQQNAVAIRRRETCHRTRNPDPVAGRCG